MKTSRWWLKALAAVVAFVLVAILVVVGVRLFTHRYYAIPQAEPSAEALLSRPGVSRVEGDYLRGYSLAARGDARPGTVVVFGGSEGSANPRQAFELQEAGYNVLALYFFGQDGQQDLLSEVPLDFFSEVLDRLDREQASGPLTVIGSSKGAELAANLAIRYPEIDNVVLYAPAHYTYAGLDFSRDASSFTWHGEPVPFASLRVSHDNLMRDLGRMIIGLPMSFRSSYEAAAAAAEQDAQIDIAAFDGNGLAFAGGQDRMWQSEVAARTLADANPGVEAVVFEDAGHLFNEDIERSVGRSWEYMMGGTVEGNRAAKLESDGILYDRLARWHG
ncbi:acyl-CoA thioester hydrolase/BAAT C-terminal domain-containing protein [Corynebacterium sp. LK2510]|uniref:acyl-CoA thioester hydrolase/BAAT C-terminal domain-containing protein n=1 Tax=Corynebacterium sp. LK2510 TaxID=3110472 RepID=UPI0034CD02D9